MPRKTGYTTRSAVSTLVLGNPEVGASAWGTEYDEEFTESPSREEHARVQQVTQSARASLRTPRSLKKGYVYGEDYEKLDERYGNAVSAYRDLQLQLGTLEQRMASMHGSEHLLLQAVEDQHELIGTLRKQVSGLTDSLGRLMGGVERNRSLMALMNSVQDSPPAQAATANKLMQESEVSRRLSSLETKIGDMVAAIASLSRSQAALTSRTLAATRHLGGSGAAQEQDGRAGRRRPSERIERLPNPVQLSSKGGTWRP